MEPEKEEEEVVYINRWRQYLNVYKYTNYEI